MLADMNACEGAVATLKKREGEAAEAAKTVTQGSTKDQYLLQESINNIRTFEKRKLHYAY